MFSTFSQIFFEKSFFSALWLGIHRILYFAFPYHLHILSLNFIIVFTIWLPILKEPEKTSSTTMLRLSGISQNCFEADGNNTNIKMLFFLSRFWSVWIVSSLIPSQKCYLPSTSTKGKSPIWVWFWRISRERVFITLRHMIFSNFLMTREI